MPAEEYWNSFFDAECALANLDCTGDCRDVLEFGCGYGLFTEAAARIARGTVYAIDIDSAMVEATRDRLREADLSNAVVEERDFVADGSGRPDASVDYAMLFNILHIDEPVALLRKAYRALRPGGTLGIMHWNYDPATPRGPSMAIRPRPEQCRDWTMAAGFDFVRFEPLTCCEHHYGLVCRRSSNSDGNE
jgi:SAM-dependent methyltransferase